ncbi:MAG: PaaX family transcriptional regulator [Sciscionella sp.]|nr:PaaX family transcriptional regulator [Sciscionella sp.]
MSSSSAGDGPTISRRHAAGADSARGLLLTVLGEYVLPTGGSAWTSAFIDALGRLGVEEKATRQALTRTASDGWLTSTRNGRRTEWTVSASGRQLLTDDAARINGFTGAQPDWDGRWLLVLARVPETDRAARHLMRTRLSWAGLGSPAPGVWISTHVDRADEAERVLAQAGVLADAQLFTARHHAGGKLTTMVRQAWDLDAIESAYERFLVDFSRQPSRDPFVRLSQLVHTWRRFPLIDPALPAQLLPKWWCGARAAALFHRRRTQWSAAATAAWQEIVAG